jgi:MFS family permease
VPPPAAASAEAERRRTFELAALMASAAIVGASLALSFPLLSLVLEAAGAAPAAIGLNAAAHGLGVILAAPFFGRAIQAVGAARVMRFGLAAAALLMLVFPLRVDFGLWFVLRLCFGAATAAVFVVSEAAINALVEDSRRGRVLGLYGTLFAVGYATGPLIIAGVGSEGMAAFLIGAAILGLGIAPTFAMPSIDAALAGSPGAYAARRLFGLWRVAPLLLAAAAVVALLETTQFALLPVWGLRLGMTEGTTALLLGLWIGGNILLQYPVGWLADRVPRRRLLAACAGLATLLSLALVSPAVTGEPALLWPVLLVHGGMSGGIYVLALALMGERFKGASLAGANAAFILTYEVGAMVGPPAAGIAIWATGASGMPLVFALALALLALAALAVRPAPSSAVERP